MEISNSIGQAAQFGSIQSTNNKPNSIAKDSVRPVAPEKEPEQPSNTQAQQNIIIDEQAVALYKESQPPTSKNTFSSASQDQPSAKNETAIASYQAVGDLANRESVQQLFGVDLFA